MGVICGWAKGDTCPPIFFLYKTSFLATDNNSGKEKTLVRRGGEGGGMYEKFKDWLTNNRSPEMIC